MRYKVFDVEILRTIEAVGGWDATDKMGMCCCVVYDSNTRSFSVFGDGDEQRAIDFILDTDIVVGFNHINFDWRVLLKIPKSVDVASTVPMISRPNYDILTELRKATNTGKYEKGHKLEQIAQTNLGRGKKMSGELAPVAWANGKYCDVIDYCIDDVALTRDLFERIVIGGRVIDPRTRSRVAFPHPMEFITSWKERQQRS